ncbi:MAG TPA: monofunctional biosynthetic peptidoglycan transglycosylase [Hypericibacter adhaerens]|uniref:Biosynthetic peptidoglycan transglycosylase n=1 Tax=Hypericibacter adhaerens TaxID=2602016 RepID=A0A5J6MTS4_9PROT|nr:monofunctional biosynthetic peptidoglycan transglycosylase [Hypericibacter adhaerens]QEX20135.1 monofunctional biosynthetic peptidoglycan transglycosylase [Hypericibacter adhaerens]HWA46495.1 monofunctional biosynthetic peptidoglycan transglycosylase [Hypericibacter adhaerens]
MTPGSGLATPSPAGRQRRSLPGRIWLWLLRLGAGFFGLSVILTVVYATLPPPITILMIGGLLEGRGIHKDWVPIDRISPHLIRSVIAAEDAHFCEHHGFDWASIQAAWDKIEAGSSRLRGGSTISNQTAKNVFLWPGRHWVRKGLEAYFTLLIELVWGKQRIMEVYLNVIEFGPGTYGAEAASQRFFKKSAGELTRYQAALLASVLPNPDEWSAVNPGPYVKKRANTIMTRALDAPDAGAAVCPHS